MPNFVKDFYRKHQAKFIAAFIAIYASVWVFLPLLGKALTDSQSQAVTLGVIVLMLSIVQAYLNDMIKETSTNLFHDQVHANHYLIEYAKKNDISEARLIEYDGDSVKELLFVLLQHKVKLHVLLQHPDHACSEFQSYRIWHKISVREAEFAEYGSQIEFDYYKDTASVRGRAFDDKLLSIGWYTYDRRLPSGNSGEPEVWGHNNPVFVTGVESDEFNTLSTFFEKVFQNLLSNCESYESLNERYIAYKQSHASEISNDTTA